MALYIHNGSGWQELTGTDQPYIHNGSGWQGVKEAYIHDGTTWRLSYQYDSTAPTSTGAPVANRSTNGTIIPVGVGAVSDTESGVTNVVLQRKYVLNGIEYPSAAGEDRITIYNGAPVSTVAGGTYNDAIANDIRKSPASNSNRTVYYRLRMTDSAGNIGYTAWGPGVPTRPLGTFTINATQSSTWETAGTASWRTDTDDVVSGRFDSSYEMQSGYWFYGTAVQTLAVGYTPNSATIYMQRSGTAGSSGNNRIGVHDYATRPAAPNLTYYVTDTGPSLTASAAVEYPLPAGFLDYIGGGYFYGIGTLDSPGYRRLTGLSANGQSGQLKITYT